MEVADPASNPSKSTTLAEKEAVVPAGKSRPALEVRDDVSPAVGLTTIVKSRLDTMALGTPPAPLTNAEHDTLNTYVRPAGNRLGAALHEEAEEVLSAANTLGLNVAKDRAGKDVHVSFVRDAESKSKVQVGLPKNRAVVAAPPEHCNASPLAPKRYSDARLPLMDVEVEVGVSRSCTSGDAATLRVVNSVVDR